MGACFGKPKDSEHVQAYAPPPALVVPTQGAASDIHRLPNAFSSSSNRSEYVPTAAPAAVASIATQTTSHHPPLAPLPPMVEEKKHGNAAAHRLMAAPRGGTKFINSLKGKIVEVLVDDIYDGDTVNVIMEYEEKPMKEPFALRLEGVDCPEMKPKKNVPHRDLEIRAAKIAGAVLSQKIKNKVVWVKFAKQIDARGRLLGKLFIDPLIMDKDVFDEARCENVSDWILKTKLGIPFTGQVKKTPFTKEQFEYIIKTFSDAANRAAPSE